MILISDFSIRGFRSQNNLQNSGNSSLKEAGAGNDYSLSVFFEVAYFNWITKQPAIVILLF
jgi:hypothetical protein